MKLLLDTHVAIWLVTASKLIPADIQSRFVDRENQSFVSAASIWEIAIKSSLDRANAIPFGAQKALEMFAEAGLELLDITAAHAVASEQVVTAHRDPFDRLLIAQAATESMVLVTQDRKLPAYSPSILSW